MNSCVPFACPAWRSVPATQCFAVRRCRALRALPALTAKLTPHEVLGLPRGVRDEKQIKAAFRAKVIYISKIFSPSALAKTILSGKSVSATRVTVHLEATREFFSPVVRTARQSSCHLTLLSVVRPAEAGPP